MNAAMKEDLEQVRGLKNDEIKQELTKLGVTVPPRANKEALIKLYVQAKQ